MIESSLDAAEYILYVKPVGKLDRADFSELAQKVDSFIGDHGTLRGVIIEAVAFPGWEDFGAMVAHFRFVRDHHKRISKIAVVTDSPLGTAAEKLASHFVSAEIRRFHAGETQAAKQWITGSS
ncbi:MAG TPA: STAS/SEC14 domain-containing protein [Burkholderiales bacterium]|nr:STAS/SEC14 domain-containing protein [Burkholderiales bacterium]